MLQNLPGERRARWWWRQSRSIRRTQDFTNGEIPRDTLNDLGHRETTGLTAPARRHVCNWRGYRCRSSICGVNYGKLYRRRQAPVRLSNRAEMGSFKGSKVCPPVEEQVVRYRDDYPRFGKARFTAGGHHGDWAGEPECE